MPAKISRSDYAAHVGPTVGDKLRLADPDLIIEVERDLPRPYGQKINLGAGR